MSDSGAPIKYTPLMSYKKFEVVPPFEKARQIIRTFQYELSDDDLQKILDYSRSELKAINSSRRYLQRGFRLNPRHFRKDMTVEQLISFFKGLELSEYDMDIAGKANQ